MLLTAGSTDVQKLLAGDAAANKVANIVVGTSNAAVTLADSAITGAVSKPVETIDYFSDGHVQFNATLISSDPAMVIQEVGLTDSNGVLLYRKTIPAVNKVAGATYALQYKILVQ